MAYICNIYKGLLLYREMWLVDIYSNIETAS